MCFELWFCLLIYRGTLNLELFSRKELNTFWAKNNDSHMSRTEFLRYNAWPTYSNFKLLEKNSRKLAKSINQMPPLHDHSSFLQFQPHLQMKSLSIEYHHNLRHYIHFHVHQKAQLLHLRRTLKFQQWGNNSRTWKRSSSTSSPQEIKDTPSQLPWLVDPAQCVFSQCVK